MMPEPSTPSSDGQARPAGSVHRGHHDPAGGLVVEFSHECRTHLNIVLIATQILRSDEPKISEGKRFSYLLLIEDAVKRMTTLLDELLAAEKR